MSELPCNMLDEQIVYVHYDSINLIDHCYLSSGLLLMNIPLLSSFIFIIQVYQLLQIHPLSSLQWSNKGISLL